VTAFRDHLADPTDVARRLVGFDIVVAMRERTPFQRGLLEGLPGLRLLVTTGMRNASIDMEAAADLSIAVCGTGGLGYPTAEPTWGLILALARRIPSEDRATRQGGWQATMGTGLNGKVLGLVGLGNLGSQVATIGRAFGTSLLAWSQNLTRERAEEFGATLVIEGRATGTGGRGHGPPGAQLQDPRAHRRPGTGVNEAHRLPRQHVPWTP